jgi:hypothetical protein
VGMCWKEGSFCVILEKVLNGISLKVQKCLYKEKEAMEVNRILVLYNF